MIDFVYTAKDKESGEIRKGKISADSKNAAASILLEKSLYPIKIQDASETESLFRKNISGSGVKAKDRVIFTRQLATLIKAGLPITQALNTAVDQVSNKTFKGMLQKVSASVEGGQTLASSFAQYPNVFNHIYISLVDAGEQSGTLDEALQRLASQQEKEQQILAKVRGALIYPTLVLAVVIGVVVFMLTTVLPQVASLYVELDRDLPLLTSILFAISNFIVKYWYVTIIVLVAIIFGTRAYIRTPGGRRKWDALKMRLPLFGNLMKKVYAARFTRTMASMVNSGIPLLKALKTSGEAVNNVVVQKIIEDAAEKVKTGSSLSSALMNHPEILKLVPQMIKVGEESGTLGDMLEKVATFFEEEVDQTIKNLSGIIEPVMIIFLGITVLLIVIAVLYPIYSLVFSINVNNFGSGGQGGKI